MHRDPRGPVYYHGVSNPVGLRTQLVGGLVIVLLVAVISVGGITYWAARLQITEIQMTNGRVIGHAVARVIAPVASPSVDRVALERVAGSLAAWNTVRSVQVVDRALRVLAVRGAAPRPGTEPALSQSMTTGRQRADLAVRDGNQVMVVFTPVMLAGRVGGAVRLELDLGADTVEWPVLFWVLMGFNALVLVLFVGYVVTRYVIRPVERIQQAALQLAGGDLQSRVEPEGAMELSSLGASFNAMTSSLREQIRRVEHQREELVATREQVVRSEKLASVGRLAAGVAHEVGNPLQVIIGFTELMLRGGLDDEELRDFQQRVLNETQRIHRIVRELLDYARPVDDAVERVDLAAVVEQAVQLVGPQKQLRQVEIERLGLEALPAVAANIQRLVQVVVNLLFNAADAIADGGGQGRVVIDGRVVASSRSAPRAEGETVELRVSNDGPPIPVEDRGQIFDPFFTTKDPGKGTGLGLSVAQSIIESYGGTLRLADAEQTTFVVSLTRWVD